jgi:hypothetical protein
MREFVGMGGMVRGYIGQESRQGAGVLLGGPYYFVFPTSDDEAV